MANYQRFLVKDTDRFDPSHFPQLETSLEEIVVQLNREPAGPKAEMLLSFVKDHRIDSRHASEHPGLAAMISTKSLPLGNLEDLFESSKNNSLFKQDMEEFIRSYFATALLC